MSKWATILCILAVLFFSCLGCSWSTRERSKDTLSRCPKCGDFFSSKEGSEMLEHLRGAPETRR
jgi:hypothetical protein